MPILLPSGEILKISRAPLGVGGEGKVYRVANEGRNGVVAKIYKRTPSTDHQQKLKIMIDLREPSLVDVCAWPLELLTDSESGCICGFTMNEVEDGEPIHHYYSPSWRKQNQPNASWDNLLQLASNLAAAFDSVHKYGIVVGDVNPNSLRIKRNGRVVLIDCDSFQISKDGTVHKCRVGVPSFTAPELLASSRSFDKTVRSVNHDLFSLSLLLFHVLFMGRHPFAGIYVGSGDTPIESHIKEFRYAYASDASSRGLTPPPLSILPSSLACQELAVAFENDFTQRGAVNGRTSAIRWHQIIARQAQSLNRCSRNYNHVYDKHLNSCVWCEMERHGLILFSPGRSADVDDFISSSMLQPDELLPTESERRSYKEALQLNTDSLIIPTISKSGIKPRFSLTAKEKNATLRRSFVRVSACICAWITLLLPHFPGFFLSAIILTLGFLYSPSPIRSLLKKYRKEASEVSQKINATKHELEFLIDKSKKSSYGQDVELAWQRLERLKLQYSREESDLLRKVNAEEQEAYLSSSLISDAGIPGFAVSRLATLASFGIETAGDISPERLALIPGVGPTLSNRLLDWKEALLKSYNQPSDSELIKTKRRLLLCKYMRLRQRYSNDLAEAVSKSFKMNAGISTKFAQAMKRYERLIEHEASIRADIRLLRSSALGIYGL